MTADLIAYLRDMLEQWDRLAAEVRHEIENSERSELLDYYRYMLIELQLARDEMAAALAGAIDAKLTSGRSEWQDTSYSIN